MLLKIPHSAYFGLCFHNLFEYLFIQIQSDILFSLNIYSIRSNFVTVACKEIFFKKTTFLLKHNSHVHNLLMSRIHFIRFFFNLIFCILHTNHSSPFHPHLLLPQLDPHPLLKNCKTSHEESENSDISS